VEDFYQDGFNVGYGTYDRNRGHSLPQTDYERASFQLGQAYGERRSEIARELDEY